MPDAPQRQEKPEGGSADPRIGTVIAGRYRVEARLGEGGMGAVYRVEHTHMRKRLAVKVLHPALTHQTEVVARFEREAMAAANIEHPNVAVATDFGRLEDGAFYLVLEYVEGTDLRSLLQKERYLSPARAVHIVLQILGALRRAHELGIVHRDLKPENIQLVEREGDPDFVKVLDFGVARVPVDTLGSAGDSPQDPQRPLTRAGMVYGTPEYMAPEQALGEQVDGRADLYALGVLLFEMLAGRRPYDDTDKVKLLGRHVADPIPKISLTAPKTQFIPDALEAAVTKLLAKSPADRFQNAIEASDALLALGYDAPMPITRHASHAGSPDEQSARMRRVVRIETGDTIPAPALAGNRTGPTLSVPVEVHEVVEKMPTAPFDLTRPTTRAPGVESFPEEKKKSGGGKWLVFLLVLAALGGGLFFARKKGLVPWLPWPAWIPGGGPAGTGTAAASGSGSAVPMDLKAQTLTAIGRIASGEVDSGIKELEALAAANPNEPLALRALAQGYSTANRHKDALAQVRKLLAAFPDQSEEPALEPIFVEALSQNAFVDEALTVLGTAMGASGSRFIYDVAWSGKPPQFARWRAVKALDDPAFQKNFPAAIKAAQAMRKAQFAPCAERRTMLEKLRPDFDARSLPLLQDLQKTTGCGTHKKSDCWPCLRKDKLLDDVVNEVETRAKKQPSPAPSGSATK